MNGYERIVAALDLREPDQIPLLEWSVHPNVIEGLCPGAGYFDFVEQLDLDGLTVSGRTSPKHDSYSEPVYVDRWGVTWGRTTEAYAPIEGPIKSEADLRALVPPDPHHEALVADVKAAAERFKGERFIFYSSRAEFQSGCDLRGVPEFLMDFVANPELAHGVLKMVSDYQCTVLRLAIEAGADGVMLGDDWAHNTSPFMSPAQFREFILPYFSRAVQTCKEAGGYVIKHSDGNLWPIIDMVVDAGIDGINPVQPDAGMELGEVKRRYGERVCVSGNINCGYTLSEAPMEQVVHEVKEAIRVAGPGGGYIMMSSNTLHSSVRPENYRAMVETTRTHGRYPL